MWFSFHSRISSSSFYVVFEVQSGDRMEFHVSRQQYGQLIEGDFGNLVFQGTRFIEFQRMNAGGSESFTQ